MGTEAMVVELKFKLIVVVTPGLSRCHVDIPTTIDTNAPTRGLLCKPWYIINLCSPGNVFTTPSSLMPDSSSIFNGVHDQTYYFKNITFQVGGATNSISLNR
jgi:hypothetical protein